MLWSHISFIPTSFPGKEEGEVQWYVWPGKKGIWGVGRRILTWKRWEWSLEE